MIITTTVSVEDKKIVNYLGVVTGETIVGVNVFRDVFAFFRDIVGGRAAGYEKELAHARELALEELEDLADHLGADAVVGVDIDYESLGKGNSLIMVSATGTAVTLSGGRFK